ncbi:hypothetical protein [Microbacterium sp. NPDC057650]|uniref:hypothetical protein n=1 Tax=unclassified Microbacterium TaxID=2609290 RepID=UPI00366C1D2E
MDTKTTPASAAAGVTSAPHLPDGDGERFTGYGVLGLAFDSGQYLALRVMTATTIGPAYRAVWHRDSAGSWHMYTTAPPDLSCPRFFSAAATHERVPEIVLSWASAVRLRVQMPGMLDWDIRLRPTPATRMMSALGTALPDAARRSDALLGVMGPMARSMMRAGRMRLVGVAPNRQRFQVVPTRVWRVDGSTAVLNGTDFGAPRGLDVQSRLGDFWMPQRGLFYVGDARFETFDAGRHLDVADAEAARSGVGHPIG